jgi:hypothetical protein
MVPTRGAKKAAEALAGVAILEMDLAEPASIDAFPRHCLEHVPASIIVNNAEADGDKPHARRARIRT